MTPADIDRIIAAARNDARTVGGGDVKALCDEIERLRKREELYLKWLDSDNEHSLDLRMVSNAYVDAAEGRGGTIDEILDPTAKDNA